VATFFVVPKSAAPRNVDHGGKSFSDAWYLKMLQPHAIAVTFDPDAEESDDLFQCDWKDNEYPTIFNRWAEDRGVKTSDYFFIVPGTLGRHVDSELSDTWPTNAEDIWGSWEEIEGYCVSTAFLQSRIRRFHEESIKIAEKLQGLIY